MEYRFQSLRVRLLLPLLAVALLASVAVAYGSYLLGDRWAKEQVESRLEGIEATLSTAPYPLTRQVVSSLADLTDTELITLDSRGTILQSSMELSSRRIDALVSGMDEISSDNPIRIEGQPFRYRGFSRDRRPNDDTAQVVVLFDEAELRAMRWRAVGLPLVTGLSTIILLTSVTLLLATRLIRRLSTLQRQVDQIAAGDFETKLAVGSGDEVGLLGAAVSRMSDQLRQMWQTLRRQQGQKLLHQVAGGLAHQLRNSITGARMAIELHGQRCQQDDETIAVALTQLEQTEGHIRRLLMIAAGKQQEDQPQAVGECLDDVHKTLSATAKHLGVELRWHVDPGVIDRSVSDGPSLHAALANLVLNAIQEASRVDVNVVGKDDQLSVEVRDNGDGPDDSVASQIFEPFVTSKPEGLGLGLPLVAHSAQRLGGQVEWARESDQTRFTLTADLLSAT